VSFLSDLAVAKRDQLSRDNQVIANIPIAQTPKALVHVPNAVPVGSASGNLSGLAQAGDAVRLHLQAAGTALPKANASVAVNSLGLLDLVQIAAVGLAPTSLLSLDVNQRVTAQRHIKSCAGRLRLHGLGSR
jgi:hypothetical protein